MKSKLFTSVFAFAVSIILIVTSTNSYGQTLRVYDKIGGGSQNAIQENNSDNSIIYIVGGAAIAGILLYALLRNNSNKENEADTTAFNDTNELLINSNINITGKNSDILNAKDELPVNLFLGIRNTETTLPEKIYVIGLSVRL